jgi:DNA-directed RNA polymerase specialized sigma24 family protein
MKLLIAAPNLDAREKKTLEYELNRALPGIKRRIERFSPKDRMLRARCAAERGLEPNLFHLTLSLQLPDHPIVVQKDGVDLRLLVGDAQSALCKELRRSAARIRKEHLARRRRGAKAAFADFTIQAATPLPIAIPVNGSSPETNPIFARVRPLLAPLHSFAREAIRTAELAGEIPRDYLSPDDLVDQAIIRVVDNANIQDGPEALERRLYRFVQNAIDEEIAAHNPDGRAMISIEQSAPEEDRWGIEGTEVEEREYHMPFAALVMEDVLVDEHAVDPEHSLSEAEQHRLILKFLGNFHSKARSAFYLNRVEGFEPFEIAMIQNRDEPTVLRDIAACVEALRQGWSQIANGMARAEDTHTTAKP